MFLWYDVVQIALFTFTCNVVFSTLEKLKLKGYFVIDNFDQHKDLCSDNVKKSVPVLKVIFYLAIFFVIFSFVSNE